MKTLIVYYSFEGNTKLLATEMAKASGADLMELKPVKEMKSKGFMKYVWGGQAAVMQKKPKLEALQYNFDDYDRIIFGTPVWAGTFAPPFNTIFTDYKIENKDVAFFCCHAGGMGKVFEKFNKKLINNKVIGKFETMDPLKTDKNEKVTKAVNWINDLQV